MQSVGEVACLRREDAQERSGFFLEANHVPAHCQSRLTRAGLNMSILIAGEVRTSFESNVPLAPKSLSLHAVASGEYGWHLGAPHWPARPLFFPRGLTGEGLLALHSVTRFAPFCLSQCRARIRASRSITASLSVFCSGTGSFCLVVMFTFVSRMAIVSP